MGGTCAFCARTATKLTKEHIFAGWVDKLYPRAASEKALCVISRRDGSIKKYASLPFEQQVRVVCATCNNGWMNDLEGAVAPILGPMILHGRAVRLMPQVQRTVAAWAIKTAFMIQHLRSDDRIVPDEEYHRFYADRQPSSKYQVWLAHRASVIDQKGMALVRSREQIIDEVSYDETVAEPEIRQMVADGCQVYRMTFALGRVAFVVFGHTFPNSFRVQLSPNMAKVIRRIWPVQDRTTWPPPLCIEEMGGFDALHDAFRVPR